MPTSFNVSEKCCFLGRNPDLGVPGTAAETKTAPRRMLHRALLCCRRRLRDRPVATVCVCSCLKRNASQESPIVNMSAGRVAGGDVVSNHHLEVLICGHCVQQRANCPFRGPDQLRSTATRSAAATKRGFVESYPCCPRCRCRFDLRQRSARSGIAHDRDVGSGTGAGGPDVLPKYSASTTKSSNCTSPLQDLTGQT